MSKGGSRQQEYAEIAETGTLLGTDGRAIRGQVWEVGVYLAKDRFVYHLLAEEQGGELKIRIASKRSVGEYLRWVDGLFRPGEIPSESNAIHYRAARKLREVI
jgi:hypothetical protein